MTTSGIWQPWGITSYVSTEDARRDSKTFSIPEGFFPIYLRYL